MLSYLSVFYHHSNFYTVSVLLLSSLCLSLVTCFPEEGPREDSEMSEVIPLLWSEQYQWFQYVQHVHGTKKHEGIYK